MTEYMAMVKDENGNEMFATDSIGKAQEWCKANNITGKNGEYIAEGTFDTESRYFEAEEYAEINPMWWGSDEEETTESEEIKEESSMKQIEINDANRTKVAKAINFNTYPVLTIDLADRDEYGLKGYKVRIDNGTYRTGEKYYIKATLRAWRDEKFFSLSSSGVCLHREFTYSDVKEMLEWSAAPIIKPDQDIAIVVHDSTNKTAYAVYIVHTDSRIRPDCIDPMNIEKVDISEYF